MKGVPMTEKADFKKEQMMSIQGKAYLPVAARIVMFRSDTKFEYGIETAAATIGDAQYMRAKVYRLSDGAVVATATKKVKTDARGPAKDWPLETAETGAIGRALGLCGYGTLGGDFDEGDQLADAPVGQSNTDSDGRPRAAAPTMQSRVDADSMAPLTGEIEI